MRVSSTGVGERPAISLGNEDAVREASMGQLEAGDEVAHGMAHVLDIGAQPLVGGDEPAIHDDAGLLVAQTLAHRTAPDGHEQQVGLDGRAVPRVTETPSSPWVALLKRAPVRTVILRLREGPGELGADAGFLRGDESVEGLDDGDPGAPKEAKTDANSTPMTPAEHHDALGQLGQAERLVGRHDAAADPRPGRDRGWDPVARTRWRPVRIRSPTATV